jgi:hypothetical protein
MTVAEALESHYRSQGLLAPGETVETRLHDRWVRMRIGGRLIPVKPLLGHQGAVLLHDVHHLLAGYGTHYLDELEEAAWELGSGGCGPWVLMWLNRGLAVLQGALLCPRRTLRAFRVGRTAHNLYGLRAQDVQLRDVEEVRRLVLGQGGPVDERPRAAAASAGRAAGT